MHQRDARVGIAGTACPRDSEIIALLETASPEQIARIRAWIETRAKEASPVAGLVEALRQQQVGRIVPQALRPPPARPFGEPPRYIPDDVQFAGCNACTGCKGRL
jgi:hypothetical protein